MFLFILAHFGAIVQGFTANLSPDQCKTRLRADLQASRASATGVTYTPQDFAQQSQVLLLALELKHAGLVKRYTAREDKRVRYEEARAAAETEAAARYSEVDGEALQLIREQEAKQFIAAFISVTN